MEDLTKTLAAGPENTIEKLVTRTSGVRRTEITIERETYSLEIHGVLLHSQDTHCPACGHVVPAQQATLDIATNDQEAIAKIILAKARSSP